MPGSQGSLDDRLAKAIEEFVMQVRTEGAYSEDVAKLVQDVLRGDSGAPRRLAEKIAPDDEVRDHLESRIHAHQGDDTAFLGMALAAFVWDTGPDANQWHLSTLDCLLHTRSPWEKVED